MSTCEAILATNMGSKWTQNGVKNRVCKIEFGAPKMCLWLSGGRSGRQDGGLEASRPIFERFSSILEVFWKHFGNIVGRFVEDFLAASFEPSFDSFWRYFGRFCASNFMPSGEEFPKTCKL